jgi:hypothetical protein
MWRISNREAFIEAAAIAAPPCLGVARCRSSPGVEDGATLLVVLRMAKVIHEKHAWLGKFKVIRGFIPPVRSGDPDSVPARHSIQLVCDSGHAPRTKPPPSNA